MRIVEVRPNLLISDQTQSPEFKSVKLHTSGAAKLRLQTIEGRIRANRQNSKLPGNWREGFGDTPIEMVLYDSNFRGLVRRLDRISREDLMWQVFQEIWPKINGDTPIVNQDSNLH